MRRAHEQEFVDFVVGASPRLLTSAWMLTGDPHLAEELVQESLARVLSRGAGPASTTQWVMPAGC